MALVRKSFAARDANGGEDAPAAKETGLSHRKADLLDGLQLFVMKHVAVDQVALVIKACIIVSEKRRTKSSGAVPQCVSRCIPPSRREGETTKDSQASTSRSPSSQVNQCLERGALKRAAFARRLGSSAWMHIGQNIGTLRKRDHSVTRFDVISLRQIVVEELSPCETKENALKFPQDEDFCKAVCSVVR